MISLEVSSSSKNIVYVMCKKTPNDPLGFRNNSPGLLLLSKAALVGKRCYRLSPVEGNTILGKNTQSHYAHLLHHNFSVVSETNVSSLLFSLIECLTAGNLLLCT